MMASLSRAGTISGWFRNNIDDENETGRDHEHDSAPFCLLASEDENSLVDRGQARRNFIPQIAGARPTRARRVRFSKAARREFLPTFFAPSDRRRCCVSAPHRIRAAFRDAGCNLDEITRRGVVLPFVLGVERRRVRLCHHIFQRRRGRFL